jgi:photosystem II stability/assembly factor-like uncharacterized protein
MHTFRLGLQATLLLCSCPTLLAAQFQDLRFREIGPAVMGGRIHDIEALPTNPAVMYVASASGGLWKSVNKGTTWTPIFDDQPVSTFGDVAIAPSNPDVVWAGTGEQNNRQSTSWGNGVYRSIDAGKTWTHLGLENTRHIGRVRVHPTNPDVAYVAALGSLWAPSPDRGVYKTTDGGRTWSKVLYVDTLTGVVDLAMDPSNPDVLYAAAYQRLRRAWGFNGGGPGSAIYKTADGGRTWTKLANGLPGGDKGRIGLAVAASNPRVLNAIIEHATEGGVYRTEDAGATWAKVNPLDPRPMYYSHIFIDPNNDKRVYVLAVTYYKSDDGGKTFRRMPHAPTYDVGTKGDFHTMWIDPKNSDHFFLGSDGGLHETWDQGESFTKINNLPVGQFYAIGVDMRTPYFIYGGMQDNHSWLGPSATRSWIGITNDEWKEIGFGDGMYHAVDPTNHRFIYSIAQNGEVQRVDAETGDRLDVQPYPPAGEPAYRWDWVTPGIVSRHDPKVVYLGGNRLFISRDRGVTWERTQDLTRQINRDTLRLMGVLGSERTLSKNDGEQSFSEITTTAESPLDPKILWVGTDDGNIQVSRDGGRTWSETSPLKTYVTRVIASAARPGVAFATLDAHRDGDLRPYVYRTEDFGRTWTPLVRGLPASGPVHVIVEHPKNPNLLFLGTEHALFYSVDRGAEWRRFEGNLPTTLYFDLVIHPRDDDLIVATHGRSLWILDDLAPLVEWTPEIARQPLHIFSIRPAMIFNYWQSTSYRGQGAYAGENPPEGAIIDFHLARAADSVRVTVTSAAGRVMRRFTTSGAAGRVQRMTWDLRHDPPAGGDVPDFGGEEGGGGGGPPAPDLTASLPHPVRARGPFVSPGTYTVKIEAGGATATQTVEVRSDPQIPLTVAQWREREEFLLAVLEQQGKAGEIAQRARALPDSLRQLRTRAGQVRRDVGRLAAEFNGQGVRQGSLFPPTSTHRQRLQALTAALADLMGSLPAVDR